MLPVGTFENPSALGKLAALNPLSGSAATASSHGRKGGRTIASSGGKSTTAERIGGDFTPTANPEWLKQRDGLLDTVIKRTAAQMEKLPKPPIKVTLPDGKVMDGTAWVTSPLDIATGISKGLAQATCVASVRYSKRLEGIATNMVAVGTNPDGDADEGPADWELWDINRPLEGDCELQLHKFDDPRGKEVFWHSSAHILGEALEGLYGARLTHGPPTEGGFFYDSYMGTTGVSGDMTKELEKKAKAIADAKQEYERVVVTKEECLQLFQSNPFKVAMISSKLPDGSSTTVYRCGNFVDLCKGPHLPNTSRVKAFAVTKSSSALWLGKAGNDELQRVYGITFPDKKEMAEWKTVQEEAAKRDHRV